MIQNSKFKIQNSKFSGGFTLVELLASIIVLVAIGTIISGIMFSSIRGSNKTTTIEDIRQNGNYVIAQMSKSIQYAQVFDGLSTLGDDYVTSCPFSASPTPAPVKTTFFYIKVTSLDNRSIVYNCSPSAFLANGETLIDASVASLVSCSLTCSQTNTADLPIIGISFTLGSAKKTNGFVENSTPPITFQTSVTVRNYNNQ